MLRYFYALIRYFSKYLTLHLSDLAARAVLLDSRLLYFDNQKMLLKVKK